MGLVAYFNLEFRQTDVKTVFLNAEIFLEVYMSQPKCFEQKGKENLFVI